MFQPRIRQIGYLTVALGVIWMSSGPSLRALALITGSPAADIFDSFGVNPKTGPAFNFGYSGATFGRSSGFFNVRPDALATGINPALYFATQNVVRMVISKDGNVGIGPNVDDPANPLNVVCPCERLFVNGNIAVTGSFISRGMKMIVPDYVFAPDYKLRPLPELQAYIAKEQHLPEIPSATEIKAQGVNLSEFQMQLLQKIEELTLYTLQQEQQQHAQEQAISDQAAMIRELKTMVTNLTVRLSAVEKAR